MKVDKSASITEAGAFNYLKWKGWSADAFGSYSLDDAIYFRSEIARSGIKSMSGLRVAELGFGNGAFAGWVRNVGGNWVGLEIIPTLLSRAREAGFEVVNASDGLESIVPEAHHDLIVAFDVLEHLDTNGIRAVLEGARKALKPGGLFLARVPSGDSPVSTAIYRGDLTHRTLLGSSAVRQLASEAALEVVQLREPVLPLRGLRPSRVIRRVVLLPIRAFAFSFIRNILMADSSAIVSPNMIVVLRREGP